MGGGGGAKSPLMHVALCFFTIKVQPYSAVRAKVTIQVLLIYCLVLLPLCLMFIRLELFVMKFLY